MRRIHVAALLAAVLAAAPAPAQQAVRLRFLPPVGQVSHYRNVVQTWMRMPGEPAADSTQPLMVQTMYLTKKVTTRTGGTWTMTTVIDSSSIVGLGGMAPSGDMLRGLIIRQTMDSLGQVDSSSVIPPPGMNPTMAQAMQRNGSVLHSSFFMPTRPIRVGQSWTDSTTISVPAPTGTHAARVLTTYRLERVEHEGGDRVAVIGSKMSFVTDGMGASTFTKGSATGTYRLDLDAGRLLHSITDMTMVVTANGTTAKSRVHVVIELLR